MARASRNFPTIKGPRREEPKRARCPKCGAPMRMANDSVRVYGWFCPKPNCGGVTGP